MKGIKLLATAVLGLAAFTSSTIVSAAFSVPFGWYGEFNLGKSAVQNINYGTGTTAKSGGLGAAGGLDFGYKFMPFFALEAGWNFYAQTKISFGGSEVATNQQTAIYLTGKGILPIADSRVELFSKVGGAMGFSRTSIKDSSGAAAAGISSGKTQSTGLYLGIGGNYFLSPATSVVAQWSRARMGGNVGNLDLYTIGFNWIFA